MQSIAAVPDEDLCFTMRALSADVQAALALNRVALQAVASMSPALCSVAGAALEREAVTARGVAAPLRVVEVIEDVRSRLDPGEDPRMAALERALIAAADALPAFDLDAAEAALSA